MALLSAVNQFVSKYSFLALSYNFMKRKIVTLG
jgi:hypothetical protein